jgi:hypothetical protein
MSRLGIITIAGVTYDIDDLTLNEMEEIENLAGQTFGELNYAGAKTMKAFTFVLMKRDNPAITMEEVGNIKVASFVEGEEALPPLPPDVRGDQETQSQGESPRDDSGPQLSADSTAG